MKFLVIFGVFLALAAGHRIRAVTLSESVSFKCTAAGSFADPVDQSKFYFCVSTGNSYLPTHISCAFDYSFDEQSRECTRKTLKKPKDVLSDSREAIPASTKAANSEPFECPGLGPFPINKQSYYYCISDGGEGYIAIKIECGAGTEYIPEIGTCGIPGQEGSTTENPGSGGTTLEPEPFVCPEQGLHANPVDKSKFYYCLLDGEGGFIPIELECGKGTQFIPALGGCGIDELPETTTVPTNEFKCPGMGVYPNPDDQKSYYFCFSNGEGGFIPVLLECGKGQEFHPEDLECVDTETEVTTTTEAPIKPFECTSEGVFADPTNDAKYFYCLRNSDGSYRKILFNCNAGMMFNPDKKHCVSRATTITSTTLTTTTPVVTTVPTTTEAGSTVPSTTEPKPESTSSLEASSTVPVTITTQEPETNTTTAATTTIATTTESQTESTSSVPSSSTSTTDGPGIESTTTTNTASTPSTTTDTTDTTTPTAGLTDDPTVTTPTSTTSETTTPAPFSCSQVGMFPDPTNDQNFYVCIWDGYDFFSILMQCSDGLIFFPKLYRCAPPGTDPNPPKPPIVCRSVGNHPDPEDCHTYYYCYSDFDGGYLTVRKACPTGTYFNPEMEACVDASNGVCLAGSMGESHVEDRSDFRCPATGLFSDPRSDQTYFFCFARDGVLQYEVKSCYGGGRFAASLGRCVNNGLLHW